MTDKPSNVQAIWNPESGILDIDGDGKSLAASEIPGIKAVWTAQKARLKGTTQLKNFTERLNREWAIETGIIENLYEIERGVTQTLIDHGFKAELLSYGSTNKPRDYVIQLLEDQQDALEGVFDFVASKRSLTTSYIKELHAALLRSQDTTDAQDAFGKIIQVPLRKGEWKLQSNFPVRGGSVFTYCPPEHTAAEMDRLIEIHEKHEKMGVPSEVQAAWLHHRFTQIHPFQDGNGRVARALASLLLVKDGLFPLVVTRDDKPNYLSALEAADSGDLKPLVDLISKLQITQFRKATAHSEAVLANDDVEAILGGLLKSADKIAADKLKELRKVFDAAHSLEKDLGQRLNEIAPTINSALQRVKFSSTTNVAFSTKDNEHYFWQQIIQNAKSYLHYYVDMAEYRSWVSLNLNWTRRARVIFAFHGIGKPFNGSLICAPFMEFRNSDDDNQNLSTVVPVAEEGFVFFYNENREKMLDRFHIWRESVLKVALTELSKNL